MSFLLFDSIGVPFAAQMEKDFSSPSDWQETKTCEWIETLIINILGGKIFLERQVNLHLFVKVSKTLFQKLQNNTYRLQRQRNKAV